MTDFQYDGEPIHVIKDNGFSMIELLSSGNRKKSRERMNNPDYVPLPYIIKELFAEIGIVVYPERMTMCYVSVD